MKAVATFALRSVLFNFFFFLLTFVSFVDVFSWMGWMCLVEETEALFASLCWQAALSILFPWVHWKLKRICRFQVALMRRIC